MTLLSDHFAGVSAKRLSAVETERHTSNQHEFNGTSAMKRYLGMGRQRFLARFFYLGEDEDDRLVIDDTVTWYDARENHPTRSEYRLYFSDNEVMNRAAAEDVLIASLCRDGALVLLVVSSDSPLLESVLWLFGLPGLPGTGFETIDPSTAKSQSSSIFASIAEEIGLEIENESGDRWLDLLLDRFGLQFPSTRALSALALETLGTTINAIEAPDAALITLMDREEELFRELERKIVSDHLKANAASWSDDVDAFVHFSLSVHNRRKSRAGHALENHLEWTFFQNDLHFNRGAHTEGRSKPDFLFPGKQSYQDPTYPAERLTMLGVKTSCKDRWRQVLNEAKRIDKKHLLTLQPAISEHQTREMEDSGLSLVLPESLHTSYTAEQKSGLLTLNEFLSVVKDRQQWSTK
ncbi:type II restriction endonuclease [Marinobacter sp. NFXS9]|uniref:type II restriction endonuclease n=1 Tax=Marinobacter sp. NFXS9 TaxID=2818433 RepID=UPI0032DFAF6B